MPTMNISLTDHLKDVVEKKVSDGRYSNASEYVRELIRADETKESWLEDDLLNEHQAARLLGFTPSSLAMLRARGNYDFPFIQFGKHIRYRRSELEKWLEQHRVTPKAEPKEE